MRRFLSFFAAIPLFFACGGEKTERPAAEIGLFYGGQIQQREVWEVTSTSQNSLGFHVEFPVSELAKRTVSYQVTRPGPLGRRVTETRELSPSPNQRSLDERIEFREDAFGLWNVRVEVDGVLAADRAIVVTRGSSAPAAR